MPLKWSTCARRFLSQCPLPLPPPPPGCSLDHCPVAEHPSFRVSGEWGKGRVEGEEKKEVGKKGGGDPVVFHGGEGSSSQLSPSLYRQAHFPGTQATFLHLAQAETIASNWDSQQRHGPSGILSFSFSFSSFLPPSFSFSLSPSSFLPPFIGVYLQSLQ